MRNGVVRSLHHGFHGFFIQAEVQNRVHHAGHGFTGAGTHGHQQGHSFRIAELAPQDLLHSGNAFLDLRVKLGGISAAVIVVVSANLRRDGESGRDRKADAGHFRKVGALAAQKIFHAAIAVGGPSAERIDDLSVDALHAQELVDISIIVVELMILPKHRPKEPTEDPIAS